MVRQMKISLASLMAIPALFFLAGCAVHGVNPPAAGPLPERFMESPSPGAVSAAEIGRWWESFGDQRLDALVEEALGQNLDLARGYARLAQLEAAARIAEAGRQPFLNFTGQAGLDRQPTAAGGMSGDNYRLSLAGGYEVDLWKKLESRQEAAALEATAGREELKTLYLTVTSRLVDLYYLAVQLRAQLDLADRIVAARAETVKRIETRYREGLVQPLDLHQARQGLATARTRRPELEANLAFTEHAIAVLAGRFPEAGIGGDLAVLPATPAAFPAGLPSELLARRPDIVAAGHRVRARDARLGEALAARFPSFNLLAGYGLSRSELPVSASGYFWNLAANLLQPVLDGGRLAAEADRSRGALDEEMAVYRQTVLTAFQEVEDGLAANRLTEERIVLLAEQMEIAVATLQVATDGYFQGLNDYLPVLTAEIQQFEAENQLLAARRQLIADRISLIRALGGGGTVGGD